MSDEDQIKRLLRQTLAAFDGRLPEDELDVLLRQAENDSRAAARAFAATLERHRTPLTPANRRQLLSVLGSLGQPVGAIEALPAVAGAQDIDARQFRLRARAIVERLAPKLKPEWARMIAEFDRVGEWGLAVTDLASALAVQQVQVTVADRDELRVLIASLPASTEDVEQLNIADAGSR